MRDRTPHRSYSPPAMFEELLPPDVITRHGHPADAAQVSPEEEQLIARAVPKRQREFRRARECARSALEALGISDFPVLSGEQREPLWPPGVVGSVTHTEGLCAVAVAPALRYRSIGIDVERDEPLEVEIARRVCRQEELQALSLFADLPPLVAARLVFSAKESLYKCQFPLTRQFVEFEEVAISLERGGAFSVTWRRKTPLSGGESERLIGRWRRSPGFLLTAMWLQA